MTYYIMQCGCKLQRQELIVISNKLHCPEHKEKVGHVQITCEWCGDVFQGTAHQGRKKYCAECSPKKRLQDERARKGIRAYRPKGLKI